MSTNVSDRVADTSVAQKNTILQVQQMLIAPCCYTQSIDVHMSAIAETMRQEVSEMVLRRVGKQKIFDHYKAIYGERILMVPDGRMGQVVSAVPRSIFALASGILFLVLRKVHQRKVLVATGADLPTLSDAAQSFLERVRREVDF